MSSDAFPRAETLYPPSDMEASGTPSSASPSVLSPTATYVNLEALKDGDKNDKTAANSVAPSPSIKAESLPVSSTSSSSHPQYSSAKKWTLLALFSAAMFIDSECSH